MYIIQIHVFLHICMYLYVYIHVHIYVDMCICMHACMYVWMHACMYVCMYDIHMDACLHVCAYTHTYIYTYTFTPTLLREGALGSLGNSRRWPAAPRTLRPPAARTAPPKSGNSAKFCASCSEAKAALGVPTTPLRGPLKGSQGDIGPYKGYIGLY